MRLIDADAMIDRLKEWDTKDKTDKALYNFTLNRINEQPTIQPVRHGHWTLQEDRTKKLYGWHICSECGAWIGEPTNYCSNCGADMRGEQNV